MRRKTMSKRTWIVLTLLLCCIGLFAGTIHAQDEKGAEPPELDSSRDFEQYEDQLAHDEQATLFPIPDYSGDLFSRAALTGDWGGARTGIAEKGIQLEVSVQEYYQGVTGGGFNDNGDWEANGTSDYRLKFDSGKSGLWPGGFLEFHGESYWENTVNSFTGALLPVNFDPTLTALAGNGTYLSHVIFTQFLSERFAITGGKIDTSLGDANDYAHGVGDQQFMNAAFNLNPVTYLTSPYSTLGGGFVYLLGPEKQNQFVMMVYDGDSTINKSGFDTIDGGRTTIGTTLRLRTNFFDKKGHQFFGFLYGFGNNEYDAQGVDPRLFEAAKLGTLAAKLRSTLPPSLLNRLTTPGAGLSETEREKEDSTWAFFYNFDQQLVSDPNNSERDWGLFGRIGVADNDTSVIETFWSIGLGGKGLFPGRPRDRFGLGFYYMTFADERVKLILPSDEEKGLEVFYTLAVTPWFELSGDVQVIDGALPGASNATVVGFRGRIEF